MASWGLAVWRGVERLTTGLTNGGRLLAGSDQAAGG